MQVLRPAAGGTDNENAVAQARTQVIAGSRIVDANSLAHLGFQRVMMRDWGGILMPSVLHGFKAADPVTRIIFLLYGKDKKYQDIHW